MKAKEIRNLARKSVGVYISAKAYGTQAYH